MFAREPRPGRVKTRLVPLLGAEGAARLHARLVRRALATACAAAPAAAVELCATPSRGAPYLARLAARHGAGLASQGGGDLGTRMHRAFARLLQRHRAVVLIGSDCPALGPADLRAALRHLAAGADAVLAPAEDGGYALIGLRRASRRVFSGIDWGTAGVLAQTRRRLRLLGWRWHELRTVWDVDRPEDVARLRRTRLLSR